ncbi:MAG: ABC-2 transporter permease [Bacillota bacterium]
MFSLVHKEFMQLRSTLLQVLGLMVVAATVLGRVAEELVMSSLFALPVVLAMTLPQLIFEQEERGNTFVFLRALPIRPSEIVAAKYLVSAITTIVSLALIGLARLTGALTAEVVLASIFGVGLICFALSALSLFLHFWLGTKPAKAALIVTTFALAIPVMLAAKSKAGVGSVFGGIVGRVQSLATSYSGIPVSLAVGLVILGISYVASAAIFSRRDLSRLP